MKIKQNTSEVNAAHTKSMEIAYEETKKHFISTSQP